MSEEIEALKEQLKRNHECKSELYQYGLEVHWKMKTLFLENEELKKKLEAKDKEVEQLTADFGRAETEMKKTLELKTSENEKQLTEIEQRTVESERFQLYLNNEKDKCKSFLEENKRLKEEVKHHKAAINKNIEETSNMQNELRAKTHSLNELMQSQETVQKLKQGWGKTITWLLRFGDGLLLADYLTAQDADVLKIYHDCLDNFKKMNEKECVAIDCQVPSTPREAISIPKKSVSTHSDSVSRNHVTVDSAVSPFRVSNTVGKTTQHFSMKSNDGSNSERSHSKIVFPRDRLSSIPLSPISAAQKKDSASGSNPKQSSPIATHSEKSCIRDHFTRTASNSHKRQRLSHQSSLGFEPIMDALPGERGNTDETSGVVDSVPPVSFVEERGPGNVSVLVPYKSENTGPTLEFRLHRSGVLVNYWYDNSYLCRSREGSTLTERVTPSEPDNMICQSNHTDHHGNFCCKGNHHEKRKRHLSTSPRPFTPLSPPCGNITASYTSQTSPIPLERKVKRECVSQNDVNTSEHYITLIEDYEVNVNPTSTDNVVYDSSVINPAGDMIEALEGLDMLRDKVNLYKPLVENLISVLSIIDSTQYEQAVEFTVNFLCSRNSNPLEKILQQVPNVEIVPLDELCIIDAYRRLDSGDLKCRLENALRDRLFSSSNVLSVAGSAALCRVLASLLTLNGRKKETLQLYCDLFKKDFVTAPYLVATSISVCHDVMKELSEIGSEKFILKAISYLMNKKPPGLDDNLWAQATDYFPRVCQASVKEEPDAIASTILNEVVANSRTSCFSDADMFNYITAIELLVTRHDWSWMYINVIKDKMFPILETYLGSCRRKNTGAVGLCYKLLGVLAIGKENAGICYEFIKKTIDTTLTGRNRVPEFVLKEAFHTQYILHLLQTKEVDEDLLNWLHLHGMVVEKTSDILPK